MEDIQNGVLVIVDGLDGEVIVDPSEETVKAYEKKPLSMQNKKLSGLSL